MADQVAKDTTQNIDTRFQSRVFSKYYSYDSYYCQSSFHYSGNDIEVALKCNKEAQQIVTETIEIIQAPPPTLTERTKQHLSERLKSLKYYQLEVNAQEFAILARQAWNNDDFITALDMYRKTITIYEQTLEYAQANNLEPHIIRITKGNISGMLTNSSQTLARHTIEKLKSIRKIDADSKEYHILVTAIRYIIGARQKGLDAYDHNPEWSQYLDGAKACESSLISIVAKDKTLWTRLYIDFENSEYFLGILKKVDRTLFNVTEVGIHTKSNAPDIRTPDFPPLQTSVGGTPQPNKLKRLLQYVRKKWRPITIISSLLVTALVTTVGVTYEWGLERILNHFFPPQSVTQDSAGKANELVGASTIDNTKARLLNLSQNQKTFLFELWRFQKTYNIYKSTVGIDGKLFAETSSKGRFSINIAEIIFGRQFSPDEFEKLLISMPKDLFWQDGGGHYYGNRDIAVQSETGEHIDKMGSEFIGNTYTVKKQYSLLSISILNRQLKQSDNRLEMSINNTGLINLHNLRLRCLFPDYFDLPPTGYIKDNFSHDSKNNEYSLHASAFDAKYAEQQTISFKLNVDSERAFYLKVFVTAEEFWPEEFVIRLTITP